MDSKAARSIVVGDEGHIDPLRMTWPAVEVTGGSDATLVELDTLRSGRGRSGIGRSDGYGTWDQQR